MPDAFAPSIYVLAGTNGADKTRLLGAVLANHQVEFYNPDVRVWYMGLTARNCTWLVKARVLQGGHDISEQQIPPFSLRETWPPST
jgi:predicted ABC-type ATPase